MADIGYLLDKKKEIITNLVQSSVMYSVAISDGRPEQLHKDQVDMYRTQISEVNQELLAEFRKNPRYKCGSCDETSPGKIPMFLGLYLNCACEGTQLRADARIIVQTESKQMIRSLEDRIRNVLVSTH